LFQALGIETESELDELFSTLISATDCENCHQTPFDINATCTIHAPHLETKYILTGIKKFSQHSQTISAEGESAFGSQSQGSEGMHLSSGAQRLLNPSYATGAKQRTRRLHKLPQTAFSSAARCQTPLSGEARLG
jgi:hypothetical protein